MQIVVGNEDFRKLRPIVITLLDVVNAGKGFRLDARCVIEAADKFTVVVGQQKFAADLQQGIPQADMSFSVKPSSPTFL